MTHRTSLITALALGATILTSSLASSAHAADKKDDKAPATSVDVSKGKPDPDPALQAKKNQDRKDDKALTDAKKDGSYYQK